MFSTRLMIVGVCAMFPAASVAWVVKVLFPRFSATEMNWKPPELLASALDAASINCTVTLGSVEPSSVTRAALEV